MEKCSKTEKKILLKIYCCSRRNFPRQQNFYLEYNICDNKMWTQQGVTTKPDTYTRNTQYFVRENIPENSTGPPPGFGGVFNGIPRKWNASLGEISPLKTSSPRQQNLYLIFYIGRLYKIIFHNFILSIFCVYLNIKKLKRS